jgi:hypothetical protein
MNPNFLSFTPINQLDYTSIWGYRELPAILIYSMAQAEINDIVFGDEVYDRAVVYSLN